MPTIVSLQQIKDRLKLPSVVTDQDGVLSVLQAAVEERVLDLTGFNFTGGQFTEQQTDVQLGWVRTMKFRPLLPVVAGDPLQQVKLSARSLASATFSPILGDIYDAFRGRVIPLASELTPIFPPIGGLAPWFRWRQMIWPIVLFTYNVDPLGSPTNPIPNPIIQAVIEWVVSIYSRPGGGAISDLAIEKVKETYIKEPTPPLVMMLLRKYIRDLATTQF